MEKDAITELKEIKKLMIYQLLAAGVPPKGIAKLVGLSEKSIRNQYTLKGIQR